MVKNKAKESNQQSIKRAKIDEQTSFLTDEEKRVILIQYQKEHESDSTNDLLVEYLKFMQVSYLISLCIIVLCRFPLNNTLAMSH